ncbi:hypothetical protein GQ53DRAFT_787319 [Thozetella sp. PMI_491]|nr:hypothetical protein GQ53DRAFT_787319 [Thozetella sp. PMI_491]
MSPDTSSPLYPDRPIRPLPKRRLRERLSPEVADSIEYPPAPESSAPLFYYPHDIREDDAHTAYDSRQPRRNTPVEDSEDEELALRRNVVNRQVESPSRRLAQLYLKSDQGRQPNPQPPPSAASSVDGYDSLENSNNKKKRKIPSAGDLAGDRVVIDVSSQGGSLATTAQTDGRRDTPQAPPYYGHGSPVAGAQNVPGPGRGRYGRVRSGRSPLRPLADSTNSWGGRGKSRSGQLPSQTHQNTGIIADAIANAEKIPQPEGQENQSLLHQQHPKPSPGSSQFTFTCDSQVPGSTPWPGADPNVNMSASGAAAPASPASHPAQNAAPAADGIPHDTRTAEAHHAPPTNPQKKAENINRELKEQARARRRNTRNQNRQAPPKPEDLWVCDFCLYEDIFGTPPRHLIRDFELKERKQRQQEAALKRKMEKMKKDARKGKKGGRVPAPHDHSHDRSTPPHVHHDHDNYESEIDEDEYDGDDYDDEASCSRRRRRHLVPTAVPSVDRSSVWLRSANPGPIDMVNDTRGY